MKCEYVIKCDVCGNDFKSRYKISKRCSAACSEKHKILKSNKNFIQREYKERPASNDKQRSHLHGGHAYHRESNYLKKFKFVRG